MSDNETPGSPPHPNLGGKSIQSVERPRYKSWRKKYRKMRYKFDGVFEENKRLFREEQKLECTAKRLREELDGLLELMLDLNQSPSIPPTLRFNISQPRKQSSSAAPNVIPPNITPEQANDLLIEYTVAVRSGRIPPLDLHVIRQQIDEKLAAQDAETLDSLVERVPHPILDPSSRLEEEEELGPSFLTTEQEIEYLARLDAKNPLDSYSITTTPKDALPLTEGKHWAELTPREQERQLELLNPQSQHNWLKMHSKNGGTNLVDNEDTESLASHDTAAKPARKRGGKSNNNNLAKQVGDRALERAKGEGDPSAAPSDEEGGGGFGGLGGNGGSGKKRTRDPDGTYRLKGSKSAAGGGVGAGAKSGGKRKRSAVEDVGEKKRVKVEGEIEREDEGGV